jgi:hypothetical protein
MLGNLMKLLFDAASHSARTEAFIGTQQIFVPRSEQQFVESVSDQQFVEIGSW